MVKFVLTLLFLQLWLAHAGWGYSGKGWSQRSYGSNSNGGRWQNWSDGSQRPPFQPQTVRIEVDHVGRSSSRKDRKSKKDKKRRRNRSMSSSSSSSSPSVKNRRSRKDLPQSSAMDSRLQAELEALRKEKADRDAQAQKEALLAEVRAIAAEGVRSAPLKAGSTQHMPDGSVALGDTKDQLTPPDRMAVFHTLDGYEKVKKTMTWLELEETLASEEESVLKELYRKVCRRGGAPRSKPAMAHKLVQGLKNAIAEFSTA